MGFLKMINGVGNRSPTGRGNRKPVVVSTAQSYGGTYTDAEKLSAVYACLDIRSGDVASLPNYLINRFTKERSPEDPLLYLLNVRPNVRMTAFSRRKILEYSVYVTGNAYDWIIRDKRTRKPVELIPLTGDLVQRCIDPKTGNLWYQVLDPVTKENFLVPQEDICDYKGPSHDGVNGVSVLSFAADVVRGGLAAMAYNRSFYENGGQPSGLLMVDGDLGGFVLDSEGNPTEKTMKDAMREEWEKTQGGPENAHKIAILDHGLKYQSLAISQKDSMFIEQQGQTVADIARYFNMPLYKLQDGKQSYNSNEQQAIEYAGSLRPSIIQREQEMSYKLLTPSQQEAGWAISTNMMALMRSDGAARSSYYNTMRSLGAYSVNDIRALEDMPGVEGGDEYAASLNYVPLKDWARLSVQRAGGGKNPGPGEDPPEGTDPEENPETDPEAPPEADPETGGKENNHEHRFKR